MVSWPSLKSLIRFLSLMRFRSDFSSLAKVAFCKSSSIYSMSADLMIESMSAASNACQSKVALFSANENKGAGFDRYYDAYYHYI